MCLFIDLSSMALESSPTGSPTTEAKQSRSRSETRTPSTRRLNEDTQTQPTLRPLPCSLTFDMRWAIQSNFITVFSNNVLPLVCFCEVYRQNEVILKLWIFNVVFEIYIYKVLFWQGVQLFNFNCACCSVITANKTIIQYETTKCCLKNCVIYLLRDFVNPVIPSTKQLYIICNRSTTHISI